MTSPSAVLVTCLLQLPWEYVAVFDADFEVRQPAAPAAAATSLLPEHLYVWLTSTAVWLRTASVVSTTATTCSQHDYLITVICIIQSLVLLVCVPVHMLCTLQAASCL
jgi:hypothetical protein